MRSAQPITMASARLVMVLLLIIICTSPWAYAGRCSSRDMVRCRVDSIQYRLGAYGKLEPLTKVPETKESSTLTHIHATAKTTSTAILPDDREDGAASGGPSPAFLTARNVGPFDQRNRPQSVDQLPLTTPSPFLDTSASSATLHGIGKLDPFGQRNRPQLHPRDRDESKADFELCCTVPDEKCVQFNGMKDLAFCYNERTYIFHLPNGAQGNLVTRKIQFRNGTEGKLEELGDDYRALTIISSTTTTPTATGSMPPESTANPTRNTNPLGITTRTITETVTATPSPFTNESSAGEKKISGMRRMMALMAAGWMGFAAFCLGNGGNQTEHVDPLTSPTESSFETESGTFLEFGERDDRLIFNAHYDSELIDKFSQGHLPVSTSSILLPSIKKMPRGASKMGYRIRRFFSRKPSSSALPLSWTEKEETVPGYDTHWDQPGLSIEKFTTFQVCQCPLCGYLMPVDEFHIGGALPAVYEDGGIEDTIPMNEFLDYVVREGFEGYVMVKEPVLPTITEASADNLPYHGLA